MNIKFGTFFILLFFIAGCTPRSSISVSSIYEISEGPRGPGSGTPEEVNGPLVELVEPTMTSGDIESEFVWTVSFINAANSKLLPTDILILNEASSNCRIASDSLGGHRYRVSISRCSAVGKQLQISLPADLASDASGNRSAAKIGNKKINLTNTFDISTTVVRNKAFRFKIDTRYVSSLDIGAVANTDYQLPLVLNKNYDLVVDWGDNSVPNIIRNPSSSKSKHTYSSAGVYEITVMGVFPQLSYRIENGSNIAEDFASAAKLIEVVSFGDTAWTSFEGMFAYAENLTAMPTDISQSPNLTNVFSFKNVFLGAHKFNVDIKQWNTSFVTNMDGAFKNAKSFDKEISQGWNVCAVTSRIGFDEKAVEWASSGKPIFSTGSCNPTVKSNLIAGASTSSPKMAILIDTSLGSVNKFGVSRKSIGLTVIAIEWGDSGQTTLSATILNTEKTYVERKLYLVTLEGNLDDIVFQYPEQIVGVVSWGSHKWTTMEDLFADAVNLRTLPTTSPDLTLTKNLGHLFRNAQEFNEDLGHWNVSNVEKMYGVFFNAHKFNRPLGAWNTGQVTELNQTFMNAYAFNKDLNTWNTSKVTTMDVLFANASSFNKSLNAWNVASVTNMNSMFAGAISFDGNISNWNTSNVTKMDYMFNGATKFNQNISSWNTAVVTSMKGIFANTSLFNQNLSVWDVCAVTSFTQFNSGALAWTNTNFHPRFGVSGACSGL